MRAVVQRVLSASVSVDNETVSSVGRGLMVLVGVGTDDNASDVEMLCNKIVKDIEGEVLCVSQFTLMATTTKNKPDFHRAMATEPSRQMYASFLERMRRSYHPDKIKDGRFGAMMNVSLTNEGPVTFTLDSRKFEYVDQPSQQAAGNTTGNTNTKKAERAAKWVKAGDKNRNDNSSSSGRDRQDGGAAESTTTEAETV